MNNSKPSENIFYRSPSYILLSSKETYTKCLNFESNKVSKIKKMTTKQKAANFISAKSKATTSMKDHQ